MSLHLNVSMEMKYPFKSILAPIHWNLKEPIIFRQSNSIIRPLVEFRSVSTVRSFYNVFGKHNIKAKAMEKSSESDSLLVLDDSKKVKEDERRRKIGLANKGKVPWNKGKKHSQDTRRRIKQRTIEALRNPKVRKKMSEHQQPHSDETREKIRASVKLVWAQRSRAKRLKEKFMSLWSENVADSARRGGSGEVELDWDSYENAKQEISYEQLQVAEEKARTKEQSKMRAEETAQARREKSRRVAERKKEREERDLREGKVRKPKQKNKENATIASRSKLKKRLTKIHKKKTSLGKIAIGEDRVVSVAAKLEKLDLELIKKERTRGDISLADQIQAAKSLRGNDVLSRFGLFARAMVSYATK